MFRIGNWVKFLNSVCQFFDEAAVVILVFMVSICGLNVLTRYFWRPIPGTYEIVAFSTGLIICFGLANCGVHKGHVAVEFITDRLAGRVRFIVNVIVEILSIGFFALATWRCIIYGSSIFLSAELSETLHIVVYPFVYALAISLLMLCLVHIARLFTYLSNSRAE